MMCCEKLAGMFLLALGATILIVAVFPACIWMFLVAFLLIGCGIWLLRRR